MDAVFQQGRLTEAAFGGQLPLRLRLTEGTFWTRLAGCHTVYRGQDGNIDYDVVQAVMELTDASVTIANQDLPADTIWHFVRRRVSCCGLESPDGSPLCIVKIDSAGDAFDKMPNQPLDLTVTAQKAGKVKLQWRYSAAGQQIAPTGYKIYTDSGSGFDFETPTATVAASAAMARNLGSENPSWTSAALTNGQLYKFCVRSYTTAGGETTNTNYVAVRADSVGPAAITNITATWEVMA